MLPTHEQWAASVPIETMYQDGAFRVMQHPVLLKILTIRNNKKMLICLETRTSTGFPRFFLWVLATLKIFQGNGLVLAVEVSPQ